MPANKEGHAYRIPEGVKVVIIETFDNKLMFNIFDDLYYAKEIKQNSSINKEFETNLLEPNVAYSWVLPKRASWRTQDFLGKQKHKDHSIESYNSLC